MLVRFRLNRFGLRIDTDKHLNITERVCLRCSLYCIEDQYHVMAVCTAYNSIRLEYFGDYNFSYDKFIIIMSSSCKVTQMATVRFLRELQSLRNSELI